MMRASDGLEKHNPEPPKDWTLPLDPCFRLSPFNELYIVGRTRGASGRLRALWTILDRVIKFTLLKLKTASEKLLKSFKIPISPYLDSRSSVRH